MEEKTLSLVVPLEPRYLDENIRKHIETALAKQIGSCTQEHGYLVKFGGFTIKDTEISRVTADIIVRLNVKAYVLKPRVDAKYQATVSACVNGNGIYAHCHDKLKILILERNFSNSRFENGKYVFPDKTIQIGDVVNVIIKAIKYEKNNFQCIGILE